MSTETRCAGPRGEALRGEAQAAGRALRGGLRGL